MNNKIEQYNLTFFWQIMSSYIVIMFIQELLLDKYLINFTIDSFIGVISLFILIINLKIQFKILNEMKLKKNSFIFGIITIVFALFTKIISIKSPYDLSFLILVIGILTAKKIFIKEVKKDE